MYRLLYQEKAFFCYISTISYDTDGTDEPIFEQYFCLTWRLIITEEIRMVLRRTWNTIF